MNPRTGDAAEARETAYSTEIPRVPGYYVYRLWAGDECLYVGRTGDSGPRPPQPRLGYHRRTREWWPEVTRIEILALSDHPSMTAEERAQIERLKPRYNKKYLNCTHDRSQPRALLANGECRACSNAREAAPARKAARRAYEAEPERKAQAKETRRIYQPRKNALKRMRRRKPGSDQGGLW